MRIQCERRADKLRRCCRDAGGCVAVVTLHEPGYSLVCDRCHRDLGTLPDRVSIQLRIWVAQGRTSLPLLWDADVRP